MFILRFSFANHRSFRDDSDLTLVQSRLRTSRPQEGTWMDYTTRVAAIYGANASGKSGVLDALLFMQAMIRHSAGRWSEEKRLPRAPFALDEKSGRSPSSFVLDFVIGDVRHEYGFSINDTEVVEEWLYSYPTGRKRILFERGQGVGEVSFGRELKGGESIVNKLTGRRELVLSKGASLGNKQLGRIHHQLSRHLAIARFEESDRQGRLRSVMEDVADGDLSIEDLQIMLRVADIGIAGAALTKKDPPASVEKFLRQVFQLATDEDASDREEEVASDFEELDEEEKNHHSQVPVRRKMDDEEFERFLEFTARSLTFRHFGAENLLFDLDTEAQSTGTLSWLSLVGPALRMLRVGGVLAVDELDASLHPQLSQVLVQMFRDPRINEKGSQLIFTTHDTYFMSPTSDVELQPDEVWLCEKTRQGVSELFSVSDFPTRKGDNLSRRYLQGRYGAVPSVAPSFLLSLARLKHADDDDATSEGERDGAAVQGTS